MYLKIEKTETNMTKIGIYITSYNRKEMLLNLISQIENQKTDNIGYDIIIFDDQSDFTLTNLSDNVSLITNDEHRGKQLFWKTWNEMFSLAFLRKDDYTIFLQDDVTVAEDFLNIAVQRFENLKRLDHKTACLSLLTDEQRKLSPHACWTGKRPKIQHNEILSHFNDCMFICDNVFFELLEYTINEVPLSRWKRCETLSSGVGRQMSLRIMASEYNMYHCLDTMVGHGNHPSIMNPDERLTNPLIANL